MVKNALTNWGVAAYMVNHKWIYTVLLGVLLKNTPLKY